MTNKETNIIDNYFINDNAVVTDGVVVECGTAEGFHEPSITLEKKYNWKFFGFEADPRFFPILCQNRPNSTKINAALSDENGIIDFTISAWGGNSSINHSKIHAEELITYPAKFEDGSYFKKISVPTINWDSFTSTYNLKKIDFLILDVEGQEIKVLNGFTKNSILPNIIQIEFAYSDHDNALIDINNKENFSGFIKISKRLFELNYQFDYVNYNNAYFSQKSFWKEKDPPLFWKGEDEEFIYRNICYYHKEKCKNILMSLK
jgi:FkbM family methyltransferase